MGRKVYIDGEFVDKEDAKVSVFDHGLLYGDGVFEGIRAYNGRVFRLEQHVARLYESASAILLDIPLTQEEMCAAVVEAVRINGLSDAYIRLVVTRGSGDLGLDPRKCPHPVVIIIADSIQLFPEEMYETGIELVTVSTRRNRPDALNPGIKSLNYLNNIIAKIEVNRAGALEGLMLNSEGYVAEGTGDNIFIVKDGRLRTPAPHCGILVGITRNCVIELAREAGIPVDECVLTVRDIYQADECFLTGTGAETMPVISLDGRSIGDGKPGPITRDLIRRFRALRANDGVPVAVDACAAG